jgi:ectoine hydroxylase-related dioxygenase (phytanoyl-CoA dioxygenase family)
MAANPFWLNPGDCDLAAFDRLTAQTLRRDQVPLAAEIIRNVPVYDMAGVDLSDPGLRRPLQAEWATGMLQGAGIVVLRGAYADTAQIDRATAVFRDLIAAQSGGADHFAAGGANDRVWNSLQKLCLADPETFVAYHGNPSVDAVCEAWLGPDYQMTAQVNQVRPGGAAQTAHRDYHMGFKTADQAARFPGHVHELSATLTLQGAIAHIDMNVESGPTKLLPFSQTFRPGFLAYHIPAFRDLFEERAVQIPLSKGDCLFFNPALFHAAGANHTGDVMRLVNLLQVSSAFGRAMETIDRDAMCRAVYPALAGMSPGPSRNAAIAACAEGYPFPTNMDTDPPVGGLAPESQAGMLRRALAEGWTADAFGTALTAQTAKRRA